MRDDAPARFYDDLSEAYHLIYADWQASIDRQGEALVSVLQSRWSPCRSVLDAACGIGTQALGLAANGLEVVASDISEAAVGRARQEAASRGLDIEFWVADLRDLTTVHPSGFDAVIACDNAIPHLLSDDEILQAFREMRSLLRPGGGCLISVRDYSAVEKVGSQMIPYGSRTTPDGRVHLFQVWDFEPGDLYDLSMFFVWERGQGAEVSVFRSRYYAVDLGRLESLLREAGFEEVECLSAGFFQPLLVGTCPAAA